MTKSARNLLTSGDKIPTCFRANLVNHNNNTTNLVSPVETFTPFHKLFVKMPHCMVPGCKNASQLCDGSVSFHRIPTDKAKQKVWLSKIPRANPRPLPYSYVCSDHFSKDCFEISLMEQLTGNKQRRRLRPEAVPTDFLNRSPVKPRKSTQLRFQKRARNEVGILYSLHS